MNSVTYFLNFTAVSLERGEVNKKERRYDIRPRTEVNAKPSSFWQSRGLPRQGPGSHNTSTDTTRGAPERKRIPRPSGASMFWVRGGGLGGRVRVFHGSLGSRGADCVVVARGTVCFVVELTFSQGFCLSLGMTATNLRVYFLPGWLRWR